RGPRTLVVVAGATLEHGLPPGRAGIGAATLEALERALDALALDWLQQIVHRRGIEGLQRVIVEGGDEDDEWTHREPLEQLEPGHPGHVDVEEERLDLARRNLDQRRLGRRRGADYVDTTG